METRLPNAGLVRVNSSFEATSYVRHEQVCCLLWLFRKKRQQGLVDVYQSDETSIQLPDLNDTSSVLEVPNEIKKDKFSSNNLPELVLHDVMETDENVIEPFNNNKHPRHRPSSTSNESNSISSRLTATNSLLTKTRRENKRLVGELRALRTAYSQVQADLLHWKSQAKILLERAKIFETQLKDTTDGSNPSMFKVSGVFQKLRLPAIYSQQSFTSLSTLPKVASTNSLASPREANTPSTVNTEVLYLHLIPFGADLVNIVPVFKSDARYCVKIRQKLCLSNWKLSVCQLSQNHGPIDSQLMDVYKQMEEKYQCANCRFLWFVHVKDTENFEQRVKQADFSSKNIIVRLNCPAPIKEHNFTQNNDECDHYDSTPIELVGDLLQTIGNPSVIVLKELLAAVGQLTYLGYELYDNKETGSECVCPLDLSKYSTFFSLLHLELRQQTVDSQRFPIVVCQDSVLLHYFLSKWLNTLRYNSDGTRPIFYDSIVVDDSSVMLDVISQILYRVTRWLYCQVELKPFIAYPSATSIENIIKDFCRNMETLAESSKQPIVLVLKINNFSNELGNVLVKKVCSAVFDVFKRVSNCRAFAFTDAFIDNTALREDNVVFSITDHASEISSCSFDDNCNRVIHLPNTEVDDFIAFAKATLKSNDSEFDDNTKFLFWLENSLINNAIRRLSLNFLNVLVRFYVHLKIRHSNFICWQNVLSTVKSDEDILIKVLCHLVGENCLEFDTDTSFAKGLFVLAHSINGLSFETLTVLVPELRIELWNQFFIALHSLGLTLPRKEDAAILKSIVAEDCIKSNLPFVDFIQLNMREQIIQALEVIGKTAELESFETKLLEFYLAKLSSGLISPREFSDLMHLLSFKESNYDDVLTNPIAMHLLYQMGELVRMCCLLGTAKTIPSSCIIQCQQKVLTDELTLPIDISRGHILISLSAIAADCNYMNLSISLLADAADAMRSDCDDMSFSFLCTTTLCNLMTANLSLDRLKEQELNKNATSTGHRATIERNLASAAKHVAKIAREFTKDVQQKEVAVETGHMAVELFSSHLDVLQLQLKQEKTKTNTPG